VGSSVLSERRVLADDGVVVVTVCVDSARSRILSGPQITTRGWIDESEAAELLSKMDNRITERVADALRDGDDLKAIEKAVRRAAGSFVSQSTRRRPMIVPIVLEG